MTEPKTLLYTTTGPIARITLNRPERGNGITLDMPQELARCVEQANLDPTIHVIALSGNGRGFCGGYDLVESAEQTTGMSPAEFTPGSPLDPAVFTRNHDPAQTWDPMVDYAMMSRNLRGFMSLFHSDKPVVCKVHGFCVAGGTDMALCSDLLVIADDAKIGYPPARVWGVPTSALWAHRIGVEKAKRLLMRPAARITEVAYDVGFQSLSHFNRSFRRIAAESPSEFRMRMKSPRNHLVAA